MAKLSDKIKAAGEGASRLEPKPAVYDADEWQRETAMDVPDAVKKDPRYKGMRFRWLHPSVISQRGWRRWKTVHISGTADEINTSDISFQHQTDTVVRRGDLILACMPEALARSRAAYYARMNSNEEMQRKSKEELTEEMESRGIQTIGKVFGGERKRIRRKVYGGAS